MVEKQHLMGKVHGVLVMTLLEMLWFQVLIIVYHLVLIIKKNNFLVLGKGPTQEINDSTGAAEKEISKVNTKFCLSLHYNGDEGYFYVNKTYEQMNNLKSKYNIS